MGIVEEECDASLYWMQLRIEAGIMENHPLHDLMDEADQRLAGTVTSIKTAPSRK